MKKERKKILIEKGKARGGRRVEVTFFSLCFFCSMYSLFTACTY